MRDLAHALAVRGHTIEVVSIATSDDYGTTADGPVVLHRLRTTSQRVPHIYETPNRPHAPPLPDPELPRGIAGLLSGSRFDVAHAHDWIVNSLIGPARHTRTPVVFTLHDYSHVCATKRMMRGEHVCAGPAPLACVRCASAMYGPVVGPGVAVANLAGRHARKKSVATFIPVSPIVASRTGLTRSGRYEVIPNFVPDEILVDPVSLERGDRPTARSYLSETSPWTKGSVCFLPPTGRSLTRRLSFSPERCDPMLPWSGRLASSYSVSLDPMPC